MPRFLVTRSFPDGLPAPSGSQGAQACVSIVERNAEDGVTWLHSYVTDEGRTTYCIYDGPSPEAIRRSASGNGLPIDRITEVRVLDPYFYT